MSISLLLVPLAVAAATGAQAALGRRADGQVVCQVQTRMRDVALLAEALRDTGAAVALTEDTVTATWESSGTTAVFSRDPQGIWAAHFTGVEQQRAVDLIQAVDTAYGRQVQRAVVTRLREQAPRAGLRLESESVSEDASVRLVFEVRRERS